MLEEILQALIPFSTPLNLVLLAALYWMARDRGKILESLESVTNELIAEKGKRSEWLERVYKEFFMELMERGEAMSNVMATFTQKAADVLERLDK